MLLLRGEKEGKKGKRKNRIRREASKIVQRRPVQPRISAGLARSVACSGGLLCNYISDVMWINQNNPLQEYLYHRNRKMLPTRAHQPYPSSKSLFPRTPLGLGQEYKWKPT